MILKHVSPSQFKVFDLCQRKWWLEKCSGLPRPESTASQRLGTSVHDVLETWALGKPEPADITPKVKALVELVKPLMGDLPARVASEDALVENRIWISDDIAPPLLGFIDVLEAGEVIDYKTSGDISKYGATPESLATDLQMVPYALFAMRTLGLDTVKVSHVQVQTKGEAKAARVSATLTLDAVDALWRSYFVPKAAEMRALAASATVVGDVTPTYTACSAFGGCPHAETCLVLRKTDAPQSPFAAISNPTTALRKEQNMSNLRTLMATKALAAAQATPQEAASLAGALADTQDRSTWGTVAQNLLETFRASLAKPPAAAVPPLGINPPQTPPAVAVIEDDAPAPADPASRVEKPLGASSVKTPEEYQALAQALHAAASRTPGGKLTAAAAGVVARKALDAKRVAKAHLELAATHANGALVYLGGGVITLGGGELPSWDIPEPVQSIAPAPEPARPEPTPVVDPVTPRRVEPSPMATHGLALFIDCTAAKLADGSIAMTFSELIEPLVQRVATANRVTDPLLMDYGKGKAEVAALLRSTLPVGADVFVDSHNPYWDLCSHVLTMVADTVIRGR